jgi:3'5'-cyclic nucleotide phosphodiesterase/Adenylate and Guanylate cyclase catalytic domain
MESTGIAGKIQVSQNTAKLLKEAGKEDWLSLRQDPVEAKGKGTMITYWLQRRCATGESLYGGESGSTSPLASGNEVKEMQNFDRLLHWSHQLLKEKLKLIISSRGHVRCNTTIVDTYPVEKANICESEYEMLNDTMDGQLLDFIKLLAHTYQNNSFHNFEHACHVAMSASNLLDHIREHQGYVMDPLTEFGIIFSALIHDADHFGLSNQQLIQGGNPIAIYYDGRSVAENNSIEISWKLFIQTKFDDLRCCLFISDDAMEQFRQLIVDCVLATDIFDKDLNNARKSRWEKMVANNTTESSKLSDSVVDNTTEKKAIVMEHIMQVSDVIHTMQHWTIYQKWNQRLFCEMYKAYHSGQSDENPADNWYLGELYFFDEYIIPLAKKLSKNDAFDDVSCNEFLCYAVDNRNEWKKNGKEVLISWIAESCDRNDESVACLSI